MTNRKNSTNDVKISVSDYSEIGALQNLLGLAPAVHVSRVEGRPHSGELGALDVLIIAGGSSSLIAAFKMVPDFLRARRSGLSITMTVRGEQFTIAATNIEDVMPIIERTLNG